VLFIQGEFLVSKFSDDQKKIALLLLSEPKTEEELQKQLNLSYDKLLVELKGMLKLGLLTKDGYPTRYKLRQDIISELQKRKKIAEDDSFKIKVRAIIELKAVEANLLKKHIEKIKEALSAEKIFTVYGITVADIVEEDEMCSSFIETTITVRDFSALVAFVFYYAPTTIEVMKPSKIEFSQAEFGDGLIFLNELFQKYAQFAMKHLDKEAMDKFNREIYE
jgi:hypothetical protein